MNDRRDASAGEASTARPAQQLSPDGRGRMADRPSQIPAVGWKDIALRVKDEVKNDRVPLVAAGVAFYGMLALFPGLTALISVYGLVADPERVQTQIEDFVGDLRGGAGDLIIQQTEALTQTGTGALSVGLAVSVLAALWTASSGMHGVMQALTIANNEPETRSFVRRRAVALGLTLVALVVALLAMGVIVVVPIVLGFVGLDATGEMLIRLGRWPLIGLVTVAVVALIYRYGPDREEAQWRWVSWGAVLATLLWVLGSVGFSVYVSNFGDYNETYGAIGAVIVLLLWLFLSAFVVILGAEVNAEMEHQTGRDTTTGRPLPMGEREAQVADHVGERYR